MAALVVMVERLAAALVVEEGVKVLALEVPVAERATHTRAHVCTSKPVDRSPYMNVYGYLPADSNSYTGPQTPW